ncbi:PepSY domain-containing protein [Rhodomicrobium sp. Az07]|uniref:PepSY domain-containing protein n=1 Tax=Rhodomicrobium sp. Az07 TaxID=2839034 RepID=UPI001BE50AC8|nr:PepSY domain-containing protein [Rhodomicrobium sp. Az07]MBT3071965.1 PepSY domain-containing protein [Rhodomicrobium sp. Az07]
MRNPFKSAAVAFSVVTAAAMLASPTTFAKDDDSRSEIRQGLKQGDIKSLSEILLISKDKVVGEVIEAEIDRKGGKWIYELEVLDPEGLKSKVKVDAKTGDVMEASKKAKRD